MDFPDFLVFLTLIISLFLLAILTVIDVRCRLLPNIYVFPFAACGALFHVGTRLHFSGPSDIILGAILGGGLLYVIRIFGNYVYKQDTLGLGDVKLMAAAGVWLGGTDVLLALTIGAAAGFVHGILYLLWHRWRTGEWLRLGSLSIPAGPGFIVGILAVGVYKFSSLPGLLDVMPRPL
jgi:leader peptidase (prepilin peptidase)/N-methyltransferase